MHDLCTKQGIINITLHIKQERSVQLIVDVLCVSINKILLLARNLSSSWLSTEATKYLSIMDDDDDDEYDDNDDDDGDARFKPIKL